MSVSTNCTKTTIVNFPLTGRITVKDNRKLDYESTDKLRLIVVGSSESQREVFGYTTVWINLKDMNDNPPRFTQDRYTSSVWENNNRGTYVTQVGLHVHCCPQ